MTLATCVLLDTSATAKVLKLKYTRRGFFSCRPNLRTRKSSNTTSTITRPNTGSSIAEQFAMAGNESDLLKQATQAMMSRYEGEIPVSFHFGTFYTIYRAFCSECFLQDAICYGYLGGPRSVLVFSCLFRLSSDDALAHVSTSKLTRRGLVRLQSGSVIEAAIGD